MSSPRTTTPLPPRYTPPPPGFYKKPPPPPDSERAEAAFWGLLFALVTVCYALYGQVTYGDVRCGFTICEEVDHSSEKEEATVSR